MVAKAADDDGARVVFSQLVQQVSVLLSQAMWWSDISALVIVAVFRWFGKCGPRVGAWLRRAETVPLPTKGGTLRVSEAWECPHNSQTDLSTGWREAGRLNISVRWFSRSMAVSGETLTDASHRVTHPASLFVSARTPISFARMSVSTTLEWACRCVAGQLQPSACP